MAKVNVYDKENKKTGEIELSEMVFNAPVNESLIYHAVRHFLARGRSGSANTKTRAEVRGSGRKVWRQKGTGRARVGTISTPIWRSGGIVFGPKPRSYDYHFPKKMKYGALRSVLTKRLKEDKIRILENVEMDVPKTKEIVEMVKKFNIDGKFLVVDDISNDNLKRSVNNIPVGKVVGGYGVNVYDILKYQNLLITRKGVEQIEEVLGK